MTHTTIDGGPPTAVPTHDTSSNTRHAANYTRESGSPNYAFMLAGPAYGVRPVPMAYRVADACYVLGIGRTSLYELVNSGELKLIKIAGRSLVPRSEIERLTSVDRAA